MKIERLKKQFIGGGEVKEFKFTQIHFSTLAYLYEIDLGNGNIHFEVFKAKNAPVCINFEKRLYSDENFKDIYPKSKSFGVWAWCFKNKEKALNKFKELNK
jgi:hypothetical protein